MAIELDELGMLDGVVHRSWGTSEAIERLYDERRIHTRVDVESGATALENARRSMGFVGMMGDRFDPGAAPRRFRELQAEHGLGAA